ncbi:Ankyrin-1 [Manis pentadactyla]|nr:Ankyrin-1 [Manis pentadactyla]
MKSHFPWGASIICSNTATSTTSVSRTTSPSSQERPAKLCDKKGLAVTDDELEPKEVKGLSCVLVEQAHVVEEGCSDEGVTAMD